MLLDEKNDPQDIFDKHFSIKCPHCSVQSNVSAVSIPRYEFLTRFQPRKTGIVYRCDACNEPIFFRFVVNYDLGNYRINISENYEEVELAKETFDFHYLPGAVQEDFKEALTCYSQLCFNAFAAMCRRCIQSTSQELGAEGSNKVQNQLNDLKSMGVIDDEDFDQLKQIILTGHDGAHPHLPKLSRERADVLLELMKDVLYQLFVRKAKIQEAAKLRQEAASKS